MNISIMQLKKYLSTLLIFVFFILLPVHNLFADLRDYIVVIKPQFNEKTNELLSDIDKYLAAHEATEPAHESIGNYASGFIFTDSKGENYIITCRHVVTPADTVNIEIALTDGQTVTYYGCPVVYIDDDFDVAVLQFPDQQNPYKSGLEIKPQEVSEGTTIFSAGFTGNKPGWQFDSGNIINAALYIPEAADPDLSYLLSYSIPVMYGNSGAPLLLEDQNADSGYIVAGMNIWTNYRDINIALPATAILQALERVRNLADVIIDEQWYKEKLIDTCTIVAAEFGSDNLEWQKLSRYISYDFISEFGWKNFELLRSLVSAEELKQWDSYFSVYPPVETLRMITFYLIWHKFKQPGSTIAYESINYTDRNNVGHGEDIRTNFLADDQKIEITWTFEYGHWVISYIKLDYPQQIPEETDVEVEIEEESKRIYLPEDNFFSLSAGFSMNLPLGKLNDIMMLGFGPISTFSYNFNFKKWVFGIGLTSGALFQSLDPDTADFRYDFTSIPVGLTTRFLLKFMLPGFLTGESTFGIAFNSIKFPARRLPGYEDIISTKYFMSFLLGIGINFRKFIGICFYNSITFIFFDENPYITDNIGLRLEINLPGGKR